jgi:hypothetical protein
MSKLAKLKRRAANLPGVPQGRHVAERAVAPYLRADVESLHRDLLEAVERIGAVERRLDAIDENMPTVLNAVVSINGNARLVRRELETVRGEIAGLRSVLDGEAQVDSHSE